MYIYIYTYNFVLDISSVSFQMWIYHYIIDTILHIYIYIYCYEYLYDIERTTQCIMSNIFTCIDFVYVFVHGYIHYEMLLPNVSPHLIVGF